MADSTSVLNRIAGKRDELLAIMARHGARNPRVFGSVARGDEHPGSDLDLLVDMDAGRSLVDLISLQQELEASLGRRVDVLTPPALNRHIRERILSEARPL
jgi:predicted nucleotidyltransferase